jgi:hypothetical protein
MCDVGAVVEFLMTRATGVKREKDQFHFDPDGLRSAFQHNEEPAPVDLAAYMKRSGDIIANAMDFRKRRGKLIDR